MEPQLPEGWKTATTPDGKTYYYTKFPDGSTASKWHLHQIPGYVAPAPAVSAFFAAPPTSLQLSQNQLQPRVEPKKKKVPKHSMHHANQSFVSKRITKFEIGTNVIVLKGQHQQKQGYITCILGTSCMVKLKKKDGEWDVEYVIKEKDLSAVQVQYAEHDHVEIMGGTHQGMFGSVTDMIESDSAIVMFWSNNALAKIKFKHMRTTNCKPSSTFTKTLTMSTTSETVQTTSSLDPRATTWEQSNDNETKNHQQQNSAPSAPLVGQKQFEDGNKFKVGDKVEINNRCIEYHKKRLELHRKEWGFQHDDHAVLKNYQSKIGVVCTIATKNIGPNCDQALVTYISSSGFEYNMKIKYIHLKKRNFININSLRSLKAGDEVSISPDIAKASGGDLTNFPWPLNGDRAKLNQDFDPENYIIPDGKKTMVYLLDKKFSVSVEPQFLIPSAKSKRSELVEEGAFKLNSTVKLTLNRVSDCKDFPWESYGAIGIVTMSTPEITCIKNPPLAYPTKYFQNSKLLWKVGYVGALPTKETANVKIMAAYEAYKAEGGAEGGEDGSAHWVEGDKINFNGVAEEYIPTVDAFYEQEPPVVVIATRVLEERRQTKKGYLWDMPSDTWLELAVYIHSIYKKFDKRKGVQTFHPTIRGHIPTTRQGRDQIMPPRATREIMRKYISQDLFLDEREQKEFVSINTQNGYGVQKQLRSKLSPEEPANGKYEYQEQQLQSYLMNRYVTNNWCCKHFAPPAPECGCWGNYDQNNQGWCCWSCKILLPICLFLIVASISMLRAAASPSYISIINLNEQGKNNIFCSRLDTSSRSVTIGNETTWSNADATGKEWSTVTIYPCKETSLSELQFSTQCPVGIDCKILGGLTKNKYISIPDRSMDVRMNVHGGGSLNPMASNSMYAMGLKTTSENPIVGAVKVGFALKEYDTTALKMGEVNIVYPPTVFPLNTAYNINGKNNMESNSMYSMGTYHPQWTFSDEDRSFINSELSYGNNPTRPFTPSCVREVQRWADQDYDGDLSRKTRASRYTCSLNYGGKQNTGTADKSCADQNIPNSQCISYGDPAWTWGIGEGCVYGANGCQAVAGTSAENSMYGTTEPITKYASFSDGVHSNPNTATNIYGREYTVNPIVSYDLPPRNYPGLQPTKGEYVLSITDFTVGIYFRTVVDDATRQEVEDWMLGNGMYASNIGDETKTIQLGLHELETDFYAWVMFTCGFAVFLIPLITTFTLCLEECEEGNSGGGGNGLARDNNGMCCNGNGGSGCCYCDNNDCAYCYLYNHGGGSRYSSYGGNSSFGGSGGGGQCNHACDGCCNCDSSSCCYCDNGGDGCCNACDSCGDSCGNSCGGCNVNVCSTSCCDGCGQTIDGCEGCCQGGCECMGSCLNGGCECLGGCCESGCECIGACGNCGDCAACACGAMDCAC